MSEYITLVSNVKTFDKNTIAEFRTRLAHKMMLSGEWVVGLTEISYTKSWFNVLYPHNITLFDEMGTIYGREYVNTVNTLDNTDIRIEAGFYPSAQKLVETINKVLSKMSTVKPPIMYYNEINNCVTMEAGIINEIKVYPHLGEEIENILGLKDRKLITTVYNDMHSMADYIINNDDIYKKELFKAYHPVEITGDYHSLFFYSNLIYRTLISDPL